MTSNFELYKQWAERAAKRLAEEERNKGVKPDTKGNQESPASIVSHNIIGAQFLEGDFGKKVHEKICADYAYAPNVTSNVIFADNVIKGTKPFYLVAVNETLAKLGIKDVRTANQAELERLVKSGDPLKFKGNYWEDSSLVYRSDADPNEYLAKHISKQLKARGVKLDSPIVVPLYCFKLEKDVNSEHGVSFKLKDDAEIIKAPILNSSSSYFVDNDVDEKTGLPKSAGKDKGRYLYTRDSGLSRLYLNWNLNVYSSNDNLANSYDNGRVVLIGAEGAALGNGGQKP